MNKKRLLERKQIYIATYSDDAIEVIKHNALNIELDHICISEMLDEKNIDNTIDEMKKDIFQAESKEGIIHGPFTELYPGSIDPLAVQLMHKRLNQSYEVAKEVGINRMVVHSGYMPHIYFREWHISKSIIFWKEYMQDKPKEFNIVVENVFEDDPYIMKEILDALNDQRITICLDIGHANVYSHKDYPVQEWIKILGNSITHMHIHNNMGSKDTHSELGSGSMDIYEILQMSKKYCSRDVTYTIEAKNCADSVNWLIKKGII